MVQTSHSQKIEGQGMAKSLIEKEIGSELLLYDLNSDEVHILNATAQVIYKFHKQGMSLVEIEKELKNRFWAGESANVSADLQRCLAELKAKGLIE